MTGIQDRNGRRRFGAAVFVLGLLLLVVALTPVAPAKAAFPGGNGDIAFISDRGGTESIWLTDGRYDVATKLPNNGQSDQPSWSPDGRYIIFQSSRDGNAELYYYDMELQQEFRLSDNSWNDESPAFSPDGREIVWESTMDGDYEIYRAVFPPYSDWWLSYDWPLTNNSSNDRAPAWSPDGKRIAFDADRDGNGEIYVMDADGSDQHNITHDPEDDWNPDWSPDGTQIAYNSRPGGDNKFEIYTIHADGSGMNRKTNEPGDAQWPSWSPDGRMIAYTNKYGGYQLKLVYKESEDEHILEVRGHVNKQPTWQPDPPTPFTPPPVKVLVIGDSITAGFPWVLTEYPLGDANADGYTDARDLYQYSLWLNGLEAMPGIDTNQFKRADTDQDKDIDATDRENAWKMVNRIYPRAWVKKGRGDASPLASYRLPLYQLLCAGRETECPYVFVGTKSGDFTITGYPTGASYPIPPKEQLMSFGVSGQATEGAAAQLPAELATLAAEGRLPDIALIHLGVNDLSGGTANSVITANLSRLISTLRTSNRNITVFVAKIIPVGYPGPSVCNSNTFRPSCTRFVSDPVKTLHTELETWCGTSLDDGGICGNLKNGAMPNSRVYLVDFNDFNSMDWLMNSDEVHPNRHGECQMAVRWYKALSAHDQSLPALSAEAATQFCAPYPDSDPSDPLPIGVADRFDVRSGQSVTVSAPGVLANDLYTNSDPQSYFLGSDQHIYHLSWVNGLWRMVDVTQSAGAMPAAGTSIAALSVRNITEPRVYYKSPDNHIVELAWSQQNSTWSYRDLNRITGGPAAAIDSVLSATTVNTLPRVYYLTSDQHIHEFAFTSAGWQHWDVTADTGAPPAIPDSPLGVTTITNDDPRVYYLAADQHVHELAWRSLTNVWYHRDVTAAAGGQVAAGTTLATTTVHGLARVYYLSPDQHVHELRWEATGWADLDVTNNAMGVPLSGSTFVAVTVRDIGEPRVYYFAPSQNGLGIHELAWSNQDGRWYDNDLTALGGGPGPVAGSPLGAMATNLLPRVYYSTADQHIHELAFVVDQWLHADVSLDVGGTPPLLPGSPIATSTGNGAVLTAKLSTDVTNGELVFNTDGSFVYTPEEDFLGQDSFTYLANNGVADSVATTVILDVTDECAPVPGNVVANFCFTRGRTHWRFRTDGQGAFKPSGNNPFAGVASAEITIVTPGTSVQFFQMGIELEPNTVYELSFAAYSSDGRDMSIWLHKHRPLAPDTNYGLRGYPVDLATYWRWYSIKFTTPNLTDMDDGRLRFWFAPFDAAGTVYHIDRVLLRPVNNP